MGWNFQQLNIFNNIIPNLNTQNIYVFLIFLSNQLFLLIDFSFISIYIARKISFKIVLYYFIDVF